MNLVLSIYIDKKKFVCIKFFISLCYCSKLNYWVLFVNKFIDRGFLYYSYIDKIVILIYIYKKIIEMYKIVIFIIMLIIYFKFEF